MFLVGWDNNIGSIIEEVYPKSETISQDKIIQYLSTIQGLAVSNTLQIIDENQNVLIYGVPKANNQNYNYSFIVLFLRQDEIPFSDYYQLKLKTNGEIILSAYGNTRKKLFQDFVHSIIELPNIKKILFIGFPNSGKTSTKLFLFQKLSESLILRENQIPTQGFEINDYQFLDSKISLFDTSGQEMNRWIGESKDVLIGADTIIFFFSVEDWDKSKELVLDYLYRLKELCIDLKIDKNNIISFCHKIDLIQDPTVFKNNVIKEWRFPEIKLFFTSIKDGGNDDFLKAVQSIISKISGVFSEIQNQFLPVFNKHDIKPISILGNTFEPIVNFKLDIPFEKKIKFAEYMPKSYFSLINSNIHKSLYIIYELETFNHLLFLNIQHLSQNLSYIICISTDFNKSRGCISEFLEKIKEYKWFKNQNK